jgi:hypothetical protein
MLALLKLFFAKVSTLLLPGEILEVVKTPVK